MATAAGIAGLAACVSSPNGEMFEADSDECCGRYINERFWRVFFFSCTKLKASVFVLGGRRGIAKFCEIYELVSIVIDSYCIYI